MVLYDCVLTFVSLIGRQYLPPPRVQTTIENGESWGGVLSETKSERLRV